MTLRTPRRRISPRTKRRYRAFKDFVRRALGSPSQPAIKINSSIAINVSDLKHKIVGLEQQLTDVNNHCRDFIFESSSIKESRALVSNDETYDLTSLKDYADVHGDNRGPKRKAETNLIYKTSESHYRKSDDSDFNEKEHNAIKRKEVRASHDIRPQEHVKDTKNKYKKSKYDRYEAPEEGNPYLREHKTRSAYETLTSTYGATTSYHSLFEPRRSRRKNHSYSERLNINEDIKRHAHNEPNVLKEVRVKKHKKCSEIRRKIPQKYDDLNYEYKNKTKKHTRDLDQDFIADIIKRQYKPIKMFGKRESDISQFSAPICRDQEYPIRENILEGSELCSCCIDRRRKTKYRDYDLTDVRSICDTRLYSAKRPTRHKYIRKYAPDYNDSNQYDLFPVKERSSPKTRHKFTAEASTPYDYYKEVPPSPRTHRPRLNLKAQNYTEFEEYMNYKKHVNVAPIHYKRNTFGENDDRDEDLDVVAIQNKKYSYRNNQNDVYVKQDTGTMNTSPFPDSKNDSMKVATESLLNKTQDTESSIDKTDKTLSEIKEILQSFLIEIKKEATVSKCDNTEINHKKCDKICADCPQDSIELPSSTIPTNGNNFNNYSIPQCNAPPSFIPQFPNPCCYPILPVCPINCMQNGYIMPSPSITCAACASNGKDQISQKKSEAKESNSNFNKNETDELIKEIYKFVAQSPNNRRKVYENSTNNNSPRDKIHTSRSAGGFSKISRHDAQVGTKKIKCQSKSCEAIGSRLSSDAFYSRTNPSYSDTVLERLSQEATATASDSEISRESTAVKKGKTNRFERVLRTLGLYKKKKDVIEEVSETGSTVEVEIKPKKPPFRQEVVNYMMHEQEYFKHPPLPNAAYYAPPSDRHGCSCHAGCPDHLNHINPMQNHYDPYYSQNICHGQAATYRSTQHQPTAPPYPNPYEGLNHNQPQVPLCLKEIEVKSIATQSERKMTIFRKFTKKMNKGLACPVVQESYNAAKNCSTQTAKDKPAGLFNWKQQMAMAKEKRQTAKSKPAMWNWKSLQAKVNQIDKPDAMNYSFKTQKQLAHGDNKMRNAMLKKLFYKRNPFSPRNLIVRTILGKDKSSYGEPPMMYRPRMFF